MAAAIWRHDRLLAVREVRFAACVVHVGILRTASQLVLGVLLGADAVAEVVAEGQGAQPGVQGAEAVAQPMRYKSWTNPIG
jgi:hypothetical protein